MRRSPCRTALLLLALFVAASLGGCGGFDFSSCSESAPCGPPAPEHHTLSAFQPQGLTAGPRLGEPLAFTATHAIYNHGLGADEYYPIHFDPDSAILVADSFGIVVAGTTTSPVAGLLEFRPTSPLLPGVQYTARVNASGTRATGSVVGFQDQDYLFETWDTAPLDPSYGDGGVAVVRGLTCGGLALDGPGGSLLGGLQPDLSPSLVAVRLDASGIAERGFGAAGRAVLDALLPAGTDQCVLDLDGAGRALVACVAASSDGAGNWFVLRLDHAGLLDPAYGTGGVARGDLARPGTVAKFRALTDGSLVLGIDSLVATTAPGSTVVRLLPDGTLDPAFVGQGSWRAERLLDVQVLSAGQLVLASATSDCPFRLARYDTSGALDPTFGDAGAVCLAGGINAMGVDGSDRLLLLRGDTGLERRTSDGALDTAFGTDGTVSVPPAWYQAGQLAASTEGRVAVQYDGSQYHPGGLILIDAAGAASVTVRIPGEFRCGQVEFATDGPLLVSAARGADALIFRIP